MIFDIQRLFISCYFSPSIFDSILSLPLQLHHLENFLSFIIPLRSLNKNWWMRWKPAKHEANVVFTRRMEIIYFATFESCTLKI